MDKKIKKYQTILTNFLNKEAADKEIPNIEFLVVIDKQNNHFQLVETGWHDKQYIYCVIFHFQIKPNGKIWLFINNTDTLVAEELMKQNVPASDIVISFHPAYIRQLTGFAVA